MRVLIISYPSLGHWHPFVPLAQALEEAGHEVAFTSTPGFSTLIESKGFRCFLAGRDATEEDLQELRERQLKFKPEDREHAYHISWFAGMAAESTYADMIGIIKAWQPQVIVRDNVDYGGLIAAEATGVPCATFQVLAPRTHLIQVLDEAIERLCKKAGVPFTNLGEMFFRHLFLFPRPLSLWNPEVPIPPTMQTFGHKRFNQSGEEALPEWVEKLDKSRPTVYATLGTIFNHRTDLLSAIVEGLRDEEINLIMVLGRNGDPEAFGEQPEHIHIERYIPQNLIFPYCDAVITHGGSGTMLDALDFGLPLVMMPLGADQPLNSKLCAKAGAAKVVSPEERTPEGIREAVRTVLADPNYREAAKQIQKEMEELPGLDYVVRLLEQLGERRAPILREQ